MTGPNSTGRLVLGTAQLGMPYGIANKIGLPDQSTVTAIIKEAWAHGIREFDTAQKYGRSEDYIGRAFEAMKIEKKVRVISKIDPVINHFDAAAMAKSLHQSLERLRLEKLHGLLLHKESYLMQWDNGVGEILRGFRDTGQTSYIGVSVYEPQLALAALEIDDVDIIQLPTNVLDRRFERLDIFKRAQDKGKLIYIRSAFLQGLLMMNADQVPERISGARGVIREFQAICERYKLSYGQAALGYLKREIPSARIIFGADSVGQVDENLAFWRKSLTDESTNIFRRQFTQVSEKILNPVHWS